MRVDSRFVAVLLIVGAFFAAPTRAIDFAACPINVPAHQTAVATADVLCDQSTAEDPFHGIVLDVGATLDLNGHTVTLQPGGNLFGAVRCLKRCTVKNGRITNSSGGGLAIELDDHGKVQASDLVIDGMHIGIQGAFAKVFLTNVDIQAVHYGIYPIKTAKLDHVTIALSDTSPSDCIAATQHGGSVTGNDVTLSGCFTGVDATRAKLTRLSVSSSSYGVFAGRVALTDSTVTGSVYADIVAELPPRLTNTTCDHSRVAGDITSWNVCSAD